jgi:hypothetical protein
MLVNSPVHVPPDTAHLDVGLVDEPPVTRCVPTEPGRIGQKRCEVLHPAKDRHVVDLNAALQQKIFDVAVGQAVPQVSAHRDHDNLRREPEPGERRTSW